MSAALRPDASGGNAQPPGTPRSIEEALRASEARYRTLAETSAVGIWQVDAQHRTLYLNPAMRSLLELEGDERLPVNALDLFFTAESREIIRYHDSKRLRGLSSTYEVEIIGKLGTRRTLLVTGAPLVGPDGRLEGTIGTFTDLTQHKLIEDHLAAEKERLAVTLRSLTDAVLTTDTDGHVTMLNDAAARLTGWTADEALGRAVAEIVPLASGDNRAVAFTPVSQVLLEDHVFELPSQTRLVSRTGAERIVAGRVSPMHDLAGRIVGTVTALRDITEQLQLEQELAKASKLESVGLLAGGIAHDFNNILTAVIGNVSLCEMDTALPEHLREWLHDAARAGQRARDLTQQLLTFAKGGDPVKRTVSLVELVREAAEFARHGSRVRCDYRIAEQLWAVEADAGQIAQVVQNLVLNAVQATSEGVVEVTAANLGRAEAKALPLDPGDYVEICVRDHGPGISAENLVHIFEPYFTTKKTGSGLGLATSYAIARRHNGLLRVESQPGHGAAFFLVLPARPAATATGGAARRAIRPMHGRVLVMDDEAPIRKLSLNLLHRLGFEAVVVENGEAVIEAYASARAEGRPFDVVILDLTVPGGIGGREAMRRLLELDPHVKAIVSTGYSTDPVLARFREHGFRNFVVKPYDVTELAEVLGDTLADPAPAATP